MWDQKGLTTQYAVFLGALIFRDHGKRTENTEMAFGNGKCNFKRKTTFQQGKQGKTIKYHRLNITD
jgi:hypothetical protein